MTQTAQIIDGVALSKQLRQDVATRSAALKARGLTPGLAVVLVGDNPASQVYVRNKVRPVTMPVCTPFMYATRSRPVTMPVCTPSWNNTTPP